MTTALYALTVRNLKVFLRDRANVFFSLLSPLIVLGLYVLFIGRMQSDGIAAALAEFGVAADDAVRAFSDSWMLSGVMATTCITVPLCACGTMIQDRIKGVSADFLASPVPSWAAPAAYFLSVLIAGAAISLVVLGVCFAYLALSGSWFLTVAEVFGAIGTALLSVVASSTMLVFLMGFLQSEGAFTGINIIVGTVTGFLIGAYIPISSFPEWVQYITLFVPGSYSAGLFRGFLMQGTLGEMERVAGKPFADALADEFSVHIDFFGIQLPGWSAAAILAGVALLFAVCFVFAAYLRAKRHRV